jgi:hypothetical protein
VSALADLELQLVGDECDEGTLNRLADAEVDRMLSYRCRRGGDLCTDAPEIVAYIVALRAERFAVIQAARKRHPSWAVAS